MNFICENRHPMERGGKQESAEPQQVRGLTFLESGKQSSILKIVYIPVDEKAETAVTH